MKIKELIEELEKEIENGTPDKPVSVDLFVIKEEKNEKNHNSKSGNMFSGTITDFGIQITKKGNEPVISAMGGRFHQTTPPTTTVNCLLKNLLFQTENFNKKLEDISVRFFGAGKQEPTNEVDIKNHPLYMKIIASELAE